ncbi:TniB family NTP-binding protein [Malaciobacter mytili]|uniref:TniB family NTP-binding protein n=1 Tax=Malaciobacter mytili TaxID=603050 RepID=UPI003BAE6901
MNITSHIKNLLPGAKNVLNKSIDDKIRKVREQIWIPYPKANLVLKELEDFYSYPKKERMPNLLIVGDTNNGKSTILNKFYNKYQPYTKIKNYWPIIKFSAPLSPSENSLYEKILDELRVPYNSNSSATSKEYQVLNILKNIETKLIIIDEFQDIFHGDVRQQRKFLTALKHLGNNLQIPIVAAGVWEVQSVLSSDPQISNRFETIVKLEKWNPDINFAKLIASFEQNLPFREASYLYKGEAFKLLYTLSEGYIGELNRVIEKAAIHAIRNNKKFIDINTLKSINFTPPSLRRR